MSVAITVTPGRILQTGERVDNAKLNQMALPVVVVDGVFGPTDMAQGDYSGELAAAAYFYGLDTGAVNAAAVVLDPVPGGYVDGLAVAFKVAFTSTGACTLNVNGLGAMPVLKQGGTQPLGAGDWQQGQIVVCRYRLDANIVPAAAAYSAGGAYVLAVIPGTTYTWTPGNNDASLVNGANTLNAAGQFTAVGNSVTMNGNVSTGVTATVIPASNVWQMLSQLGSSINVYPMKGASPAKSGIQGLAPRPPAGAQNYYLRGDGKWADAVTAASTAAQTALGGNYANIFLANNFV